jgi:hypothetical protein
LVVIESEAAPMKVAAGMKLSPFSAALIAATVPVNVIVPSAVPSPALNVSPPMPARVMTPLVAVSTTCTGFVPASSVIEIALPLPAENTSAVSSLVV